MSTASAQDFNYMLQLFFKSLDGCTDSPDGPRELGVIRIDQKFSVDIENDIISREKFIS